MKQKSLTSQLVPLYPVGHLHTSTAVAIPWPVCCEMAVSKLTSLRKLCKVWLDCDARIKNASTFDNTFKRSAREVRCELGSSRRQLDSVSGIVTV